MGKRLKGIPTMYNFPGGSDGKVSAYNLGDPGSIPESGRSAEEGNGHLLQNSRLGNPMDRGAQGAAAHDAVKSWTRLSNFTFTFLLLLGSCQSLTVLL